MSDSGVRQRVWGWPAVLAGAAGSWSGVGLLAVSGWLITRAAERPPILTLCVAIGAVQALSLGRGVLRYVQRLAMHSGALAYLADLRLGLYDAVAPLVPRLLGPAGTGEVVSGFLSDADTLANSSVSVSVAVTDVTASLMLATVLAGAVLPVLVAVVAGAGFMAVAGCLALGRFLGRYELAAARRRAEIVAEAAESARCAPELVAYGRSDLVEQHLARLARRNRRGGLRRAALMGLSQAWATVCSGTGVVAVVVVGLGHHLPVTSLAVAALATLAGLATTSEVAALSLSRHQALTSAGRLDDLKRKGREAAGLRAAGLRPSTLHPGSAELDEVVAGSSADGRPVLDGVSIAVRAGRCTAVTGPSGAGKTTALHALLRFVECDDGEARLGGCDVKALSRDEIAASAAFVSERPHIFAASLAENLRLARPGAGDTELRAVLVRVGLGAWLAALPDGLATRLGAGGRAVSAGERQRLGLARGLLSETPVVLLDEPTAHLPARSAPGLLAGFLGTAARRSVLVVSHDPSVASVADDVVELYEGRVSGFSRRG